MELTAAASFLNSAFAGYDHFILNMLHSVQSGFLTALFKLITLLGEHGILFFLIAIVLMCFSRTRKLGICLFGAVACGALITNIILKDMIARPRPFNFEPYKSWWQAIGSPAEDGYSFPSGHVTAAAAGMVAIWLMKGRKWAAPSIIWILLMMLARNYLMAHYPSDVLFALIIGIISAVIAYFITKLIYRILHEYSDMIWADFILYAELPDFLGIPSRLGLVDPEEEDYEMNFEDEFRPAPEAQPKKLKTQKPAPVPAPVYMDDEEEEPEPAPSVRGRHASASDAHTAAPARSHASSGAHTGRESSASKRSSPAAYKGKHER